jgi:apocytochrome f
MKLPLVFLESDRGKRVFAGNENPSGKTKGSFIQPYTKEKTNLMLVGPVESSTNGDLLFPALTPTPDASTYQSSDVASYANRGRGQIYPSGVESNSRNIVVKKSRNGRVLSRILGSNSDEIKLGVPTDESSSRDRRATKQKKVVKRFKRLLPAVIAKRLTVGSSLREGDEISGVTSFQGLGHAAGSIGLLEASRLKASLSVLFTIPLKHKVMLLDVKLQVVLLILLRVLIPEKT